MDNKQKIVAVVLVLLAPFAALLAFNALVFQPQIAELGAEARGLGLVKFDNPVLMNQTLKVNGATTLSGGSTGDVIGNVTGDLTGIVTATSATVGGGFGSTGCTISAAGVFQCNGAATIGGAATITGTTTLIDATAVGGGFGDTGCTLSAAGVLQCDGAATIGGAATVTGTLTVGGESFSGAVKYGTAATYANQAAITHGFATTPTVCILQPVRDVTSTLTIGATTFSSDMASIATPIYWMCGK